ncbi:transporter substrate-binding domain-containing protein [Enterobacteriaceae bacterium RIT697]|uniref:transporter substrate-binding domain-containing protein n=1 Tax=Pantoea endophytica TaxID=92488 RepID=UPI0012ADE15B|nr:transporter substrate-binding domain-containing protein [Pantoea endophytica]MRT24963.1 transporter substrate-binding domain-containing protein [Enterobacteriaceae bacterium RIT697]
MMPKKSKVFVPFLIFSMLTISAVKADTLENVKEKGFLTCGVMSNLEPFGFIDSQGNLVGYDIDFCNAVAKHMNLKPELKQISLDARIPELTQGHVDLLAAVLGYSITRAEQIDFTDQYFVSNQKIAVQNDSDFNKLNDMNGKRISTIKGSSSVVYMKQAIPDVIPVSYEDAPSAFMAMVQKKVDGFALSESMMRRFITRLGPKATVRIIDQPFTQEVWGLGVKKGEKPMLDAVNVALNEMESSGEAQQIFDKWMGPTTSYKMSRDFKVKSIK